MRGCCDADAPEPPQSSVCSPLQQPHKPTCTTPIAMCSVRAVKLQWCILMCAFCLSVGRSSVCRVSSMCIVKVS